ncbi:hypothetical protein ACFLXB_08290 [Chloroflexota bacterium]
MEKKMEEQSENEKGKELLENELVEEQLEGELAEEQLESELVEEQPTTLEVQDEPPQKQDEPVSPKKKELGKARRIWRTFLVWLTVIALSFLVGVLTLNFVRLQPTIRELTQAYNDIASLETQVSDLSTQLISANDKADLLQDAETHRDFLQVQLDISLARLALANGDVTTAKAALIGTTARLEALAAEIEKVDAGLAESLPKRLSLVISGLEDNISNAAVDLGLLATDLQNLVIVIYE